MICQCGSSMEAHNAAGATKYKCLVCGHYVFTYDRPDGTIPKPPQVDIGGAVVGIGLVMFGMLGLIILILLKGC